VLAAYGLANLLGGCLGVATATWRHKSATILRRIGLSALESDGAELPPYFDPKFDCQMELLRFDSRRPNPRFAKSVGELAASLNRAPVFVQSPVREEEGRSFAFEPDFAKPALAIV